MKKHVSPKRSITIRLIRHAESMNNEVYREAHKLFKCGTADLDLKGWTDYINEHRVADPGISARGILQAEQLSLFLESNLINQASCPIKFIISPMRRALETIIPTLDKLVQDCDDSRLQNTKVIVNAYFTESEGCYSNGVTEPGLNQIEITNLLPKSCGPIEFEGYSNNPNEGWYINKEGQEKRHESESRAAKFFLWLCEHLDREFFTYSNNDNDFNKDSSESREGNSPVDIYDAGATEKGEENENVYDKLSPVQRKRRTILLIGHGDFMNLVLKRMVAGFGYSNEKFNCPHRTAFVHLNTGFTDLEYYGSGRFLVMSTNQTPHLNDSNVSYLKSGGSLRDGWNYIIPQESTYSNTTIVIFLDENIQNHIKEQIEALKSLYINTSDESFLKTPDAFKNTTNKIKINFNKTDKEDGNNDSYHKKFQVEMRRSMSNAEHINSDSLGSVSNNHVTFVVKRGFQVVGCASFNEKENTLKNVVIRRSESYNNHVGESLVYALRYYHQSTGKEESTNKKYVVVESLCLQSKIIFEKLGYT